jgi:hypothetical protein
VEEICRMTHAINIIANDAIVAVSMQPGRRSMHTRYSGFPTTRKKKRTESFWHYRLQRFVAFMRPTLRYSFR